MAWGHNHRGQLGGIGDSSAATTIKTPTKVSLIHENDVAQIAGGEQCTFFVTLNEGLVLACGSNSDWRLGFDTSPPATDEQHQPVQSFQPVTVPTVIEALRSHHVTQLSVSPGGRHALALTRSGEVFSWGNCEDGQLGHPLPLATYASGNVSVMELPRKIDYFVDNNIIVTKVCAGGSHSAAITSGHKLYTWGKATNGRLGHGAMTNVRQYIPKLVEALAPHHVIDVACGIGDAHTLALTADAATVWSWGDGGFGKLGRGNSMSTSTPTPVHTLSDKGVISVHAASQFSAVLTTDGSVYTFGKGDYYRLGHGTEQHCKTPRLVLALRNVKIVSIALGSLHVLAIDERGRVYAWGDNDNGQLGDGTTDAIRRPQVVAALRDSTVNGVTCGSAHSFVWCHERGPTVDECAERERVLKEKYPALVGVDRIQLMKRLQLLKMVSQAVCSQLSLLTFAELDGCPITLPYQHRKMSEITTFLRRMTTSHTTSDDQKDDIAFPGRMADLIFHGADIKPLLVKSHVDALLKRSVQQTMTTGKLHGPFVTVDRLSRAHFAPNKRHLTHSEDDVWQSVTWQIAKAMHAAGDDGASAWMLPQRIWKVKFTGEAVDDCGGGYSESVAEVCEELDGGYMPLFTPIVSDEDALTMRPSTSAAGKTEQDGTTDEADLVLHPAPPHMRGYSDHKFGTRSLRNFIGNLFGSAIRSAAPLALSIAEPVWKLLTYGSLTRGDVSMIDSSATRFLNNILQRQLEDFPDDMEDVSYLLPTIDGNTVDVASYLPCEARSLSNVLRMAWFVKLTEMDNSAAMVRHGLSKVIPCNVVALLQPDHLNEMVCASSEFDLSALKAVTVFREIHADSPLIEWFWKCLQSFTGTERSLFLRFVWGRSRLPRDGAAGFKGKEFTVQAMKKFQHNADSFLPEASTCFFQLKMPMYSSYEVLRAKLMTAIYFCRTIDTDEYSDGVIYDGPVFT